MESMLMLQLPVYIPASDRRLWVLARIHSKNTYDIVKLNRVKTQQNESKYNKNNLDTSNIFAFTKSD